MPYTDIDGEEKNLCLSWAEVLLMYNVALFLLHPDKTA